MLTHKEAKQYSLKFYSKDLDNFMRGNPPPYYTEGKLDGEWAFIDIQSMQIFNRHKTTYNLEGTRLGESLKKSYSYQAPLIAEFCSRENIYDFLSDKANLDNPNLKLYIYDIIPFFWQGLDLPLKNRKKFLKDMITPNDQIKIVGYQEVSTKREIWEKYYEAIDHLGYEGIVLKPVNSLYTHGVWFKMKRKKTADLVILGVTKTDKFLESGVPFSFLVGYYDGEKFIPKSKVGSGLKDSERDLIKRFLPAIVRGEDADFVYVEPFFVLELEYDTENKHRLRSPRIIRIRGDKDPKDCVEVK